jgi:cell division protein FtsB
MEKLNQAVTEVSQLLLNQNAELSHLRQENKELKERVEKLEEELRLCKAEIIILNQLKKKNNVSIVPQQKLFGWF